MTLPIDVLPEVHSPATPLARAFRWLLVVAVAVLLVLFARTVDWRHAWESMRSAHPGWLAAAIIANLLSLALKGARWWFLLRRVGAPSLALAMRATVAGAGLNNILIANGGEAARIAFVARATGVPKRAVLATLAVERAFDMVAYAMLMAVATLTLPLPEALERWRVAAVIAASTSLAGMLALVWWRARREGADPAATLDAADRGAGRMSFLAALRSVSTPAVFAAVLSSSVAIWLIQVATYGMAARATGLRLPLAGDVATLLAANLGFLVRATPGNVGLFQLSYALAAEPFGASRDTAIAAALVLQTLQIVPVTLLGAALAPEFLLRRR